MNAPSTFHTAGEAILLAATPSEPRIAARMAESPGMTREAAIQAVQRERVQRFREHRAGEHRGASAPTSMPTSGERIHRYAADRLANATVERVQQGIAA